MTPSPSSSGNADNRVLPFVPEPEAFTSRISFNCAVQLTCTAFSALFLSFLFPFRLSDEARASSLLCRNHIASNRKDVKLPSRSWSSAEQAVQGDGREAVLGVGIVRKENHNLAGLWRGHLLPA